MTVNDIRKKYVTFFQEKQHAVVASASLLPENDPTTLFTGSGMQPMVPYLLGQKHAQGDRIADSQKCFRAQDIEEVGDNRHTTFFEMLGNWSLGAYFKEEQITWMYTFLTKELGLNPAQLYITCFRGNDELGIAKDEISAKLWGSLFAQDGVDAKIVDFPERDGMQGGRIFYYDETKNWWSRAGVPNNMPEGEPGGPDSEMFWDFAPERGDAHLNDADTETFGAFCHVNCDCGRFMEIGNNVFMEYQKVANGFEKLAQRNVDFGGGLERLAAAVRNDADMFMIDCFDGMREVLHKLSGKEYGKDADATYAYRVILDHLRAATFLIADNAVPSNKDQGYFTRRLIRRAIRFGHKLGVTQNFCGDVVRAVIAAYAEAYPELKTKEQALVAEVEKEEEKFRKTLERGLKELEHVVSNLSDKVIPAKAAFDLYQSYGFPLELTVELAEEKELSVDVDGFNAELKKHQNLSREGAKQKFAGGLADHSEETTKLHTATHLLHAALRAVLGDHVEQKGSNITAERLRFDFSHPEKMTDEQKQQVTDLVNAAIASDYPMSFQELSVNEAKEKGAIGLFEDKYAEKIKVYTVGDPNQQVRTEAGSPTFSMEICGGPHVEHTGTLGKFRIKKEEASSAGIRRIKAILE